MTLAVSALFRVPHGEASRRAGCRRSARPVRWAGMGNGALPNGPSYRAHPRLYQSRHGSMSALRSLLVAESGHAAETAETTRMCFRLPGWRGYPRADVAGDRKAPRHEVAEVGQRRCSGAMGIWFEWRPRWRARR